MTEIMGERFDPDVAAASRYKPDKYTPCIKKWLDADAANRGRLIEWMSTNRVPGLPTDLVDGDRYAADRAKAVTDLHIPCD